MGFPVAVDSDPYSKEEKFALLKIGLSCKAAMPKLVTLSAGLSGNLKFMGANFDDRQIGVVNVRRMRY